MTKWNYRFIMAIVLTVALLTGTSCNIAAENSTDKPQRLSIDELDLDRIDVDITADELERDQEFVKKEISEDGMYATYELKNLKYTFTTDEDHWGESADRIIFLDIFGDSGNKLSGPRGIQIGDDFSSVMEKFPQDSKWEDSIHGVFYGMKELSDDPEFERGSVSTSDTGVIEYITLVPKGHPPFIKIYFNNNHVQRMVITYFMD